MPATRRRTPATPPAPAKRVITPGGKPMSARPVAQRRQVTPRQVAGGIGTASSKAQQAAVLTTQRKAYTGKQMLTAELLISLGIVALRAIADYEPQADGTMKGKVGHPKGQYGPLPILAALVVIFFLLSFLAASGGLKAKLAVIAGGIIDVALLMNSSAEFTKVAHMFGTFGTAKKPPPGAWQTSGTPFGEPVQGGTMTGGGQQGGGGVPSQAPAGSLPYTKPCPAGYIAAGAGPKGPFWCQPVTGL